MKYAVIVEKGEDTFGAHVPDLPGCVAVAETKDEVLELIQEAIEFHLEGLREDGQTIPPPSSIVELSRCAPHRLTATIINDTRAHKRNSYVPLCFLWALHKKSG